MHYKLTVESREMGSSPLLQINLQADIVDKF